MELAANKQNKFSFTDNEAFTRERGTLLIPALTGA
jgi:hypothetical protein